MKNNDTDKFISFVKETDATKVGDVLTRKGIPVRVKVERYLYGYKTNYSFDVYVQEEQKVEALKTLMRSKKTCTIAEIKKMHDNACRKCSSTSVEKKKLPLILLLASLLTLGMVYMSKSDAFVCQNCGYVRKEKRTVQKNMNVFFWLVFNAVFWILVFRWIRANT
jgi:hypothetical protein